MRPTRRRASRRKRQLTGTLSKSDAGDNVCVLLSAVRAPLDLMSALLLSARPVHPQNSAVSTARWKGAAATTSGNGKRLVYMPAVSKHRSNELHRPRHGLPCYRTCADALQRLSIFFFVLIPPHPPAPPPGMRHHPRAPNAYHHAAAPSRYRRNRNRPNPQIDHRTRFRD